MPLLQIWLLFGHPHDIMWNTKGVYFIFLINIIYSVKSKSLKYPPPSLYGKIEQGYSLKNHFLCSMEEKR